MHVRLEEVCERGSSNLAQKDIFRDSGKYPVYGASGKIGNVDFYQQEFPYVAVVKDGAGIGRTMLLPAKSSVIGTMQYLLPKKNIMTEYLYYVVRYMHLEKYFSGATIPHIYFRDYKYEKFNLVSIEKQTIVCKILKKVERVIESRKDQLELLDKLTKSRFVELFGDPVNNPNNWEKIPLSAIAEIKIGPFGSLIHKAEYGRNGHAIINPSHIVDGQIVIDANLTVNNEKYDELSAYQLCKGDVVLGRRGEMGRCAVVEKNGFLCGTGSLFIRPKEKIRPEYLQKILSFPTFKKYIEDKAVGQTMLNLNVEIVSKFQIITPPIGVQLEYYNFVEYINKSRKIALIFDRYSKFLDTIHI